MDTNIFNKNSVVIFDFLNLVYRSAHAGKDLKTSAGIPSGHVSCAYSSITSIKKRFPQAEVVFALDAPRRTVRRSEVYPEYKAKRKSTLEYNPIPDLLELIHTLKCKTVSADRYEADDVIGALVYQKCYDDYTIVSTDKDLWSLMCYPNVTILNPKNIVEKANFDKSFGGLPPYKIPLHKALFGDASDCIPRVPRVRSKLLISLLEKAFDLDSVFDNMEGVLSDNEILKMNAFKEQAHINLKLATLTLDMPLKVVDYPGDSKACLDILHKFECVSLGKKFSL